MAIATMITIITIAIIICIIVYISMIIIKFWAILTLRKEAVAQKSHIDFTRNFVPRIKSLWDEL